MSSTHTIRTSILDVTQTLYLSGRKVTAISNDATGARSVLSLITEKAIKDYVDTAVGGSTIYPGAGIPISTGSAWGTSIAAGSNGQVLTMVSGAPAWGMI